MSLNKTCIYTLGVLSVITFALLKPESAKAVANDYGSSALPRFRVSQELEFDYRVYVLRKFLIKHNSPLTPYSPTFIKLADFYDIDWRMVPAISGVESTFGKRIPIGSYNAYGWANGGYKFESWPDSISVVTKTLREKYLNKGATSITKIARRYAPPSNTWGRNVNFFIGKISVLPLSFDI